MMAAYDKPVLFHDRLDSPGLEALVSRSYLANLIWFVVETSTPRRQRRFIDPKGQTSFRSGVAGLRRRVAQEGGRLLAAVISPVGFASCPAPAKPHSRCDWMARDMALMSQLLRAEKIPWLDLRDLWRDRPSRAVGRERHMGESWLAIHPEVEGHRSLAEAMLPAVLKLVREQ